MVEGIFDPVLCSNSHRWLAPAPCAVRFPRGVARLVGPAVFYLADALVEDAEGWPTSFAAYS